MQIGWVFIVRAGHQMPFILFYVINYAWNKRKNTHSHRQSECQACWYSAKPIVLQQTLVARIKWACSLIYNFVSKSCISYKSFLHIHNAQGISNVSVKLFDIFYYDDFIKLTRLYRRLYLCKHGYNRTRNTTARLIHNGKPTLLLLTATQKCARSQKHIQIDIHLYTHSCN